MRNESKQKQKPKQKQKHIFIRVDKQIEPGDLVRCIKDDYPCKVGDIRKVRRLSSMEDAIFFIHGSCIYLNKPRWEVVHKLEVGDLVELHKNGKPMKVTAVYPEDNRFCTPGMMLDWYATDEFRLYRKPKTYGLNKIEPIAVDDGVCVGPTVQDYFEKTIRRDIMKTEIAEMVVELVDKRGFIALDNLRVPYGEFAVRNISRERIGTAELHPNDTWDTLTGLFVALCRATGRDLPDWIYGKESKK